MEEAWEKPSSSNINAKKTKSKHNRSITNEHVLRKRQPQKPETGDSVIYISTKSNIKSLFDRCNKLIAKGENEITIYCLGAAIQRGILLALNLSKEHVAFQLSTNTFSTELLDDLEPAADDADYLIQRRFNSALQIKVTRTDLLASKP